MRDKIEKLFCYQINAQITEIEMCNKIGIDRRTLYNARIQRPISKTTVKKIDNFIEENNL